MKHIKLVCFSISILSQYIKMSPVNPPVNPAHSTFLKCSLGLSSSPFLKILRMSPVSPHYFFQGPPSSPNTGVRHKPRSPTSQTPHVPLSKSLSQPPSLMPGACVCMGGCDANIFPLRNPLPTLLLGNSSFSPTTATQCPIYLLLLSKRVL